MTIHDELFSIASQAVLEHQHGGDIVLRIEGQEPRPCVAIVSQEKRSRRYDPKGQVRVVRERMATVASGLSIADFDSLLAPKLSATVEVSGMKYAVEDSSIDGNSVTFTLVRDGIKEISRPDYRGLGR